MRFTCFGDLDTNRTDFTVLWLAPSTDNTALLPIQQKKVKSVAKNLKKYDTEEACEEYIHTASLTEPIVLITSEVLGRNVVPCVHQQCQLATIFVYHGAEELNNQWVSKYKKVKVVKLNTLEDHIKLFQCHLFRNSCRDSLPMNIFNAENFTIEYSSTDMNGTFLFSQLFLNILLRIKSSSDNKDEFVHTCAKLYKDGSKQAKDLKDFNINYREDDALEWYTKSTFIVYLLNKVLRTRNIDFLFLFRFFIQDLQQQLKQFQCDHSVHVYRGQLMSKSELFHLQKSIGKLISMNSFLSTSRNKTKALIFLGITDGNINQAPDDLEYVLFEIDANPDISGGTPAFADMCGISAFDEEEILFTLSSVFRVNHVHRDPTNQHLTIISMNLCGNDDHELKPVLDAMQKEYQGDSSETNADGKYQNLIPLGIVLLNMGHFNAAKKIFIRMLRELRHQPVSVDIATCYRYIGDVYRQKKHFRRSKTLYGKALKTYSACALANDDPRVATTYMCLGHAYSKTTNWKFPAWYQTDCTSE